MTNTPETRTVVVRTSNTTAEHNAVGYQLLDNGTLIIHHEGGQVYAYANRHWLEFEAIPNEAEAADQAETAA